MPYSTDPSIPRILLTAGEPAGIGPDLCIQIAQHACPAQLVVIADPELMRQRAARLGLSLILQEIDPSANPQIHQPGKLWIQSVATASPVTPGQLDPANAPYVLTTLDLACRSCLDHTYAALVTAPVHKGVINDAGLPFTGHTEFLAKICRAEPVMMMVTPGLRVALATTHLPLNLVSRALTQEKLERVLQILEHDLRQKFAIPEPRILICGLNPHAGEGGHLGHEEIDVMQPVIERLRSSGQNLTGPLPADTAFTTKYLSQADVVLAMYHDQGLPVLKHMGFGRAVNITLGLPIIRTSVDHGTALELAASGRADMGSLHAAVSMAIALVDAVERNNV